MSDRGQAGTGEQLSLITPEMFEIPDEALEINRIVDRSFNRGVEKGKKEAEIDEFGIHSSGSFRRDGPIEVAKVQENGEPLGIVLTDADGLKAINDELGHAEGDKIIAKAKSVWQDIVQEFAKRGIRVVVGRIGGDEFAARVYGDQEQTRLVAEEFEKRYSGSGESAESGPTEEKVTTSVGYSHLSEGIDSFPELMHEADERMYKNKVSKLGELSRRDRVCLQMARFAISMSSKKRLRDAPKYWRMMNVLD